MLIRDRRHFFADLQPYICTFSTCKDELKTFPTRELWEDHEFGQHRVNRYWSCSKCQHKAKTPEDWRKHLELTHGVPLSDDQYLIAVPSAEVRDSVSIELENCPLCLEIPGKSRREFATHVGKHMEVIALAALPREEESSDTESIASNTSSLTSDSGEEAKLLGGLTDSNRPAEPVQVDENGKVFSVASGEPIALEEDNLDPLRFTRSLSEQAEDDESFLRSFARRKRDGFELAPKRCREPGCDEEFRRPCDLIKHEETHYRPWKCPVETCKYHEYGWRTEKGMDRHHNEIHSSAPAPYECLYRPCPYRSKRERIFKQHMEKAHGWEYRRSRGNGKMKEGTD
jgi:hypothetical protein